MALQDNPIDVLLVEDSWVDAELVMASLAKVDNGRVGVQHTETLAEAIVALEAKAFDVILLDLSLPDSSGMDSVRRLRALGQEIPIVIMTALDDEATAVAMLQQGVQDYLVKGVDTRKALTRSLRYAIERFRLEHQIRESEVRFRDFAETAGDWFWETDAELNFTYLSDSVRSVLGEECGSMIGKSRSDLFADPNDSRARIYHDLTRQHLPLRDFIYPLSHRGRLHHIRISGKPLFSPRGVFQGYRGVGSDVTGQFEAERFAHETLNIFLDAFEALPQGLAIFGGQDELVVANDKLTLILPGSVECWRAGSSWSNVLVGLRALGYEVTGYEVAGDEVEGQDAGERLLFSAGGRRVLMVAQTTEQGRTVRRFVDEVAVTGAEVVP